MIETSAPARHGPNAFFFVIVTVVLNNMAFGIIIPVVPQLIRELMTITAEDATLWIGALGATYAVMNFLFGPLLGALSDKFGRRPVLLMSIAMLGVDFLVMALASSIWVLFLARALSGIAGATFATANAYIADTTAPEARGRAFGMIGAAFGIGFTFGPVLGGFLGSLDPRAPFFAAAALCGLNFLYGLLVLPESLAPQNRRPVNLARANPFGAFKHFSKLPHVSWFMLALLCYYFAHTVFPSTWSVYGEIRYQWTPHEIGLSLGAVGIAAAVIQAGLIGPIMKRLGPVRTVLFGFGAMTLAMLLYAAAYKPWMIYFVIPIGALGGLITPALSTLMANVTPRDAQGELQGATGSLMALSMIFGPLIMSGVLYIFTSDTAPVRLAGSAFLLGALLSLLAVIPFLRGIAANAAALADVNAPK